MVRQDDLLKLKQLAHHHYTNGQFNEAKSIYGKILETLPHDIDTLNKFACILPLTSKSYEVALQSAKVFDVALSLSNRNPVLLYNAGIQFLEIGEIFKAIKLFQQILNINTIDPNARLEILRLVTCLHPKIVKQNDTLKFIRNTPLVKTDDPRSFILKSIKDLINRKYQLVIENLSYFADTLSTEKFKSFDKTQARFALAYYHFIKALLEQPVNYDRNDTKDIVYHIGDSHSLTFATQDIVISEVRHRVYPLINIGAKAYDFARPHPNKYKSISKINLGAISKPSKIFISFGEIDCRVNGGLISASQKLSVPLVELTQTTVDNFVDWFAKANTETKHRLIFSNIPAPIQRTQGQVSTNEEKTVIKLFNQFLHAACAKENFEILDVYSRTSTSDGWSNQKHHIDDVHLGPSVLNG